MLYLNFTSVGRIAEAGNNNVACGAANRQFAGQRTENHLKGYGIWKSVIIRYIALIIQIKSFYIYRPPGWLMVPFWQRVVGRRYKDRRCRLYGMAATLPPRFGCHYSRLSLLHCTQKKNMLKNLTFNKLWCPVNLQNCIFCPQWIRNKFSQHFSMPCNRYRFRWSTW